MQNADGNGSTGMFAVWVSYGIANATDGTSNTLLLRGGACGQQSGERDAPWPRHRQLDAPAATTAATASWSTPRRLISTTTSRRRLEPGEHLHRPSALRRGVREPELGAHHQPPGWRWASFSEGSAFNVAQTPNDHQYPVNVCRGQGNPSQSDNGSNSLPATSFHPGGVNTLFVDGSVRFVKDSIARNIWSSLGTRAGGEVVSADAY